MSQQMNYNEEQRGYQASYTTAANRDQDSAYDDRFSGLRGQKVGQQSFGRSTSHGLSLALAIVSVVMLVPLAGILLGSYDASLGRYMAMGLVCLTIIVINIMFNFRR